MVRRVQHVQETVADRGREIMKYVTAKSKVIITVCLSMCLHVQESAWILEPTIDDGGCSLLLFSLSEFFIARLRSLKLFM